MAVKCIADPLLILFRERNKSWLRLLLGRLGSHESLSPSESTGLVWGTGVVFGQIRRTQRLNVLEKRLH